MNDGKLNKFQIFLFILLAFSLPLSISLSQTSYFLAFVVWIIQIIIYKRPFRQTKLEIPVIVLAAVYIAAVLFSPSPSESARILKKLILFGLLFLLANSPEPKAAKGHLINIWLSGAIIASLWTMIEYIRGIPRADLGFFGCMTFGHFAPMFLGASLSLIGLENYKRTSILSALTFIAGVFALFLTCTRGAWIGFIAGLALFFIIKRKWLFLATSTVALVLIVSVLFTCFPKSRPGKAVRSLLHPFDRQVPRVVGSNLKRWHMWKASWEMFTEHPLLGIGPYQFKEQLPNYLPQEVKEKIFKHRSFNESQSIYFDYLGAMGIIGFSALLFFFYTIFRLLISKYKSCNSAFDKNLTLGVLIAFISFCIGGLFEQNLHNSEILLNLCFLLGLVL